MISHRQVFKKSRDIIKYLGVYVPVLDLDPFIESKLVASLNDGIRIEWSKIITGDNKGIIHTGEAIEVYYEDKNSYESEPTSVFYALLTDRNSIEVFKYIPNEWVNLINKISNEIDIKNS